MKPKRGILVAVAILLCLVIPGQASQNILAPAIPVNTQAPIPPSSVMASFPEKLFYQFPDGAGIRVHFNSKNLVRSGTNAYFPQDVLNAAVEAYQIITEFQGFSTPGYAFANPDKKYAYDPDKIIDVFIGDPQDTAKKGETPSWMVFKDAPCFDTVKRSETAYDAIILLPTSYKDFIRGWEKINPSPLGTRNVEVDLRGTLIHEMLHVVVFYYNRNLNHDLTQVRESSANQHVDWYVEGLARYFETFAGARHDFFSQGFKQTLPNKIRFSRGGANYFMRYPDQPFTDLRYENALFWRFIDTRYGMTSIERLTRSFRGQDAQDFRKALEKATGDPFEKLLKAFSLAVLFKDFGLKEDAQYLKNIARTHLVYNEGLLWLKDGAGKLKPLGLICRTDWIGEWEGVSARHGELSVGGDNTPEADLSGWATDYYQIDMGKDIKDIPNLVVTQNSKKQHLAVQRVAETKGGSLITLDSDPDLRRAVKNQGLSASDVDRIHILVTNTDFSGPASYEISVFS